MRERQFQVINPDNTIWNAFYDKMPQLPIFNKKINVFTEKKRIYFSENFIFRTSEEIVLSWLHLTANMLQKGEPKNHVQEKTNSDFRVNGIGRHRLKQLTIRMEDFVPMFYRRGCKKLHICINFEKILLLLQFNLLLRTRLTWSNLSTQVFLRFLSIPHEKTSILYLHNTSTLDLYLHHKHSWKVINMKYKQHYFLSNDNSGTSSPKMHVLQFQPNYFHGEICLC